jgi:hypothetical protein
MACPSVAVCLDLLPLGVLTRGVLTLSNPSIKSHVYQIPLSSPNSIKSLYQVPTLEDKTLSPNIRDSEKGKEE